jgi:hypothetical protein
MFSALLVMTTAATVAALGENCGSQSDAVACTGWCETCSGGKPNSRTCVAAEAGTYCANADETAFGLCGSGSDAGTCVTSNTGSTEDCSNGIDDDNDGNVDCDDDDCGTAAVCLYCEVEGSLRDCGSCHICNELNDSCDVVCGVACVVESQAGFCNIDGDCIPGTTVQTCSGETDFCSEGSCGACTICNELTDSCDAVPTNTPCQDGEAVGLCDASGACIAAACDAGGLVCNPDDSNCCSGDCRCHRSRGCTCRAEGADAEVLATTLGVSTSAQYAPASHEHKADVSVGGWIAVLFIASAAMWLCGTGMGFLGGRGYWQGKVRRAAENPTEFDAVAKPSFPSTAASFAPVANAPFGRRATTDMADFEDESGRPPRHSTPMA